MVDVTATIDRRAAWPRLSPRGPVDLDFQHVPGFTLGPSSWTGVLRHLAAISLWIVLGLMAQVYDLWGSAEGSEPLPTSEERWGLRFATAWRLGVACLMGAYFVVRLLVTWKVVGRRAMVRTSPGFRSDKSAMRSFSRP